MSEAKEIMNVGELAEYLGVSCSKIYKMIKEKKVPASKIGRQYKFSKQVVDSWLKENIITSPTEFSIFMQKTSPIKKGKGGEESGSEEKSSEEKSCKENSEEKEKEVMEG